MAGYKVQSYSNFTQRWEDYITPTWGAKLITFPLSADAESWVARLEREWPRDKFRVVQDNPKAS